jgi:hypothetical protein
MLILSSIVILCPFMSVECVQCAPKSFAEYLAETAVNGNVITHCKSIHVNLIHATYEHVHSYINNSNLNLSFKVYRYVDAFGNFFPPQSPYSHPHIILNYPNKHNIDVALQLTSHPYKIDLNFETFSKNSIFKLRKIQQQYISTHLRFYDLNNVTIHMYGELKQEEINKYLNINNLKINDQFKKYFK